MTEGLTKHQMLSLMRLRGGALHWRDIGQRNTVETLWDKGLVHRSQAGRYYLTSEGQNIIHHDGCPVCGRAMSDPPKD